MLIRCVIFFSLICIVVKTIQHTHENLTSTTCENCRQWFNYDIMEFWHDILKEDCIVPHEMTIAPNVCITGWFNNSQVKGIPGAIISKYVMEKKPNLTWPAEKGAHYTLLMNHLGDLSNLSLVSFKDWQHWLVVDIPENRVEEGDTISEYKIPVDPIEIGIQRHLFWVFKQPHKLNFDARQRWWYGNGRMELNVTKFIKRYNLTGPVAILHLLTHQ